VATLVALYEKDSAGKGVEGALRVLEAALARPAVSESPPTSCDHLCVLRL
jgi:hypothetical protein